MGQERRAIKRARLTQNVSLEDKAIVKIDPTIYMNSSFHDDEVITFGKSPELEMLDIKNGVSRIGGMWRAPSYTKAYLRAARVLLQNGIENNDLDQLGLPIFYLHRHTLELFIKGLLLTSYEISEFSYELNKSDKVKSTLPSKKMQNRLNRSHSLTALNDDLKNISTLLEHEYDSTRIDILIKLIENTETETSWSRYAKSSKSSISFLENEVVIKIVEINKQLESVIHEIGSNTDGEETFETFLYYKWQSLLNALDQKASK